MLLMFSDEHDALDLHVADTQRCGCVVMYALQVDTGEQHADMYSCMMQFQGCEQASQRA